MRIGLAISVALHVVGVAWLATTGEARVLRAPHSEPPPVEVEIIEVPPEPLAVAIVPEAAIPEVAPEPAKPAKPAKPEQPEPREKRQAISTRPDRTNERAAEAGEVAGPSPAEPTPEPPGPRSRFLTMRGPKIERGLSQEWVAQNLAGKPAPAPVPETGQLAPSGGGTYRSEQGPFTVDVDRDGTAHLSDKPNFHIGVAVPRPKDIGHAITDWQKDPFRSQASADRQRSGDVHTDGQDGKPQSSNVVPVPLIGGGFDVTDALMRRHGQDPYASAKLKALDATRDERAQIGERFRKQELVKASQMMRAAAARAWANSASLADRKRALFELWDDCAEDGPPELVEAAARARGFVIGFINARLPAGSDGAFTSEELARLNAHRQSRAAFAPYAR